MADLLQDPGDARAARCRACALAYSGRDARVYRNANALPRAFLVERQRTVADDDAALAAVTDPRLRRRAAWRSPSAPVAGPAAGGTARRGRAPAPAAGRPASCATSDERVVARGRRARGAACSCSPTSTTRAGRRRVDGRDAPVERVDYLLRGVAVPAGEHTVELRYEPASWRVGWIVSVAGHARALRRRAGGRLRGARARRGAPA